jgi:gamma-glutamylcyclotransferase (GGCT)/AIG2-like uncharacterized protein YtfP
MLKVFVYGTLKPKGKYYSLYCQGKTISEIYGWTKGKLFSLPLGYPAMIPGNDRVYGYLLSFASETELINLDRLEGYTGERNSPSNEYDRFKITVYSPDNLLLDQAWAYFMTPKKVQELNGIYIASGWWNGD